MTNKEFEKEIKKWAKEFGLTSFYFCRDDRIEFAACVGLYRDGNPYLDYNLKSINDFGRDYRSVLFHEFGHIKYKHYLIKNNSLKIQIKKEYEAEKFNFKMFKKYFPKRAEILRRHQLKMINDNEWAMRWPVHVIAFRKVYEK